MEASLEGPTHCIFISIEIRAAFVLCKKIRASSRSQSGRRCDVDQRDLPHCEHYSPLRAAYSIFPGTLNPGVRFLLRSEEHTSELQSLMRISYAVLCLKIKYSQ